MPPKGYKEKLLKRLNKESEAWLRLSDSFKELNIACRDLKEALKDNKTPRRDSDE